MKVSVDKEKCIGCGTCVAIAPKSFKLDNDGKVEVINPAINSPSVTLVGDSEKKIKEAVDSCSVAAIKISK